MKEIIYYETADGKIPYRVWYDSLDKTLKLIIDRRIVKIERDLYGDHKRLSPDLLEFRFDNGLRLYFMEKGKQLVLILCGGSKSKQSKDIETAKKYIQDYKERCRL